MKSASSQSPLLLYLLSFGMETAEGALQPEEEEIRNSKHNDWQHIHRLSVSKINVLSPIQSNTTFTDMLLLSLLPEPRSVSN